MTVVLNDVSDELFKTHDLIKVLCDTLENCRKNQRPVHHVYTLADLLLNQSLKTNEIFDKYMDEHVKIKTSPEAVVSRRIRVQNFLQVRHVNIFLLLTLF